jgi:hypothetical protein
VIVFTVHEPSNAPADLLKRGEGLLFVKDGFAWWAAFPYTSFLWLVRHRMWECVCGYLVLVCALAGMISVFPGSSPVAILALIGLHLILGTEGNGLRRWTLRRRGYRELGVASGRNLGECEKQFIENLNTVDQQKPGTNQQVLADAPKTHDAQAPEAGTVAMSRDGWERLKQSLVEFRR